MRAFYLCTFRRRCVRWQLKGGTVADREILTRTVSRRSAVGYSTFATLLDFLKILSCARRTPANGEGLVHLRCKLTKCGVMHQASACYRVRPLKTRDKNRNDEENLNRRYNARRIRQYGLKVTTGTPVLVRQSMSNVRGLIWRKVIAPDTRWREGACAGAHRRQG